MKGSEFVDAVARKLGAKSDSHLARLLGKHPTQISGYRSRQISPATVAALIARFHGQTITAESLIAKLRTRLGIESYTDIARALGLTGTALRNWRNRNGGLSATQIASTIAKARTAATASHAQEAVKPIIEFFGIERTLKNRRYSVFDGIEGGTYREGLKHALDSAKGLYVFYDSRGRAVYVGRTSSQTLWKEMNHAYNRVRASQKITLVRHPTQKGKSFTRAASVKRQLRDRAVKLHDLAAFFSAYEVSDEMIRNLEAMIIRAFPNDLMNFKMERFEHGGVAAGTGKGRKKRK